MLLPVPDHIDFQCNCCGSMQHTPAATMQREGASCFNCGSSVRMRAIVHHVGMVLLQQPTVLPLFPPRPDVRGLGMSDWAGYADMFARLFSYQNTWFDREPRLDIAAELPHAMRGAFDFVICSDVLEHVAPPVQASIDNLAGLLAPGGFAIVTVPYSHDAASVEHYPGWVTGKTVEVDGATALVYRHNDGRLILDPNPSMHGGAGAVVEMRQMALGDLIGALERAGLTGVRVLEGDYPPFGIVNQHRYGLPILAWKA